MSEDRIRHAKYIETKTQKLTALKKAKASYHTADFIFEFGETMWKILFTWELRKDGYIRKAEQ